MLRSQYDALEAFRRVQAFLDPERQRFHTITIEIFGQETTLLDLPSLIRVEPAAGWPKDPEVIAELEALAEERGDLT